jgi:hypothetical protein
MVVYLASLTLWAYGLLSQRTANGDQGMGQEVLPLNEPETRETTMFLELGQGTPSLSSPEGLRLQLEPVSNYVAVLSLARLIFRQNYPVASKAMPPLVESLCRQLGDLQGGLEGYVVTKTL